MMKIGMEEYRQHGLKLYHQVLLLSFDDKTGKAESDLFAYAVSAAVLAELVFAGRIEIESNDGCMVNLLDTTPTGDAILDSGLKTMAVYDKPYSMLHWMNSLFDLNDLVRRTAKELCRMGVLQHKEETLMWVFPVESFPEADPESETAIKKRLNAFLFEGKTDVDERTVVLAVLANVANLLEPNFGVLKVAKGQERINEMLESSELGSKAKSMMLGLRRQQQLMNQIRMQNLINISLLGSL